MSNPDITPERKALALAALALDLHVDCSGFEAHHTVNYQGKLVGLADSAIEALARAAEALGLEPDPAVQQQEQTTASPPVHLTVTGQRGDSVTVHITEAEYGLRLQATGDGESSAECVSATGDVQWTSALSDSQREALLIVAEITGDLIINAEAVESGACSRPGATELLAWAEELQQPAQLLEILFDLAPKETVTLKPAPATPLTLHRTMGEARGLIQTAIGQVRDLDIPHVGEYLWGASQELDRAADLIRRAFASILAPATAPKESTPDPDPPIEQFEPMLEDWTPDPQEGGKPDA